LFFVLEHGFVIAVLAPAAVWQSDLTMLER
jgi:hypothetical protein